MNSSLKSLVIVYQNSLSSLRLCASAKDRIEEERGTTLLAPTGKGLTPDRRAELGISGRTAEYHRMMVLQKLGVDSTAALTLYAANHGLI